MILKSRDFFRQYSNFIDGDLINVVQKKLHVLDIPDPIVFSSVEIAEQKKWWYRLQQGVFSSDCKHIQELSDVRGDRKIWWPDEGFLNRFDIGSVQKNNEEVIFGGTLYSHFGHFLLDSLSRVYYFASRAEYDGMNYIFYADGDREKQILSLKYVSDIFEFIGIDKSRIKIIKDTSSYNKIYSLGSFFSDKNYVDVNLVGCARDVADRFFDKGAGKNKRKYGYVSRSKLSRGTSFFDNVEHLDKLAESLGFDIIYPEKMDIKDQLEIFRDYEVLVGLPSSFFHLKILSKNEVKIFFLVPVQEKNMNINFLNIDIAGGFEDNFVPLDVYPSKSVVGFHKSYTVNTDNFNSALKDILE